MVDICCVFDVVVIAVYIVVACCCVGVVYNVSVLALLVLK